MLSAHKPTAYKRELRNKKGGGRRRSGKKTRPNVCLAVCSARTKTEEGQQAPAIPEAGDKQLRYP
jgi:hypothetical protein